MWTYWPLNNICGFLTSSACQNATNVGKLGAHAKARPFANFIDTSHAFCALHFLFLYKCTQWHTRKKKKTALAGAHVHVKPVQPLLSHKWCCTQDSAQCIQRIVQKKDMHIHVQTRTHSDRQCVKTKKGGNNKINNNKKWRKNKLPCSSSKLRAKRAPRHAWMQRYQ